MDMLHESPDYPRMAQTPASKTNSHPVLVLFIVLTTSQQWAVDTLGFCNGPYCMHKRCPDCLWESVERIPKKMLWSEDGATVAFRQQKAPQERYCREKTMSELSEELVKEAREFEEGLGDLEGDDGRGRVGEEESQENIEEGELREKGNRPIEKTIVIRVIEIEPE